MNVWTELEFNLYFVGGASTNKPVNELSILIIIIIIIIILYYPLPLWGFSGIMKQIIQIIEHNMVKHPNWYEVNQLAIFTSVVKDLNSRLLCTNPAGGQDRTLTQGLRITSPVF